MGSLLETLNGFGVLDDLDVVHLSGAAGDEVELGFAAEVLEAFARNPGGLHLEDVQGAEILGGNGSFGLELDVECAEVAEVHLVACEELFADASHGVGQHALDTALREGGVVVGDVLAEVVEGEDFVNLCGSVGLGLGDVGLFRSGLGAHNCDTVINHSWLGFLWS